MNQFYFEFIVTKNYLEKITNITNVQHDNVLSEHKCQLENEPATYSKSVFFLSGKIQIVQWHVFYKQRKKNYLFGLTSERKKNL